MKNEKFSYKFDNKNKINLCENNLDAEVCYCVHNSSSCFNSIQVKILFLFFLLFFIYFYSSNCYAFDESLQIDEKLVNDTFGTNYTTLNDDLHNFILQEKNNNSALYQNFANFNGFFVKPTSSSGNYLQFYFFLSDNFVCSSYSDSSINIAVDNANYFYVSFVYNNFVFSEYGNVSQATSSISTSKPILTNLLLYTDSSKASLITSSKYIYSDNLFISNNLEEPEEVEEPSQVDLNNVVIALNILCNIEVLILFFLISLYVFLVFTKISNAGRRD